MLKIAGLLLLLSALLLNACSRPDQPPPGPTLPAATSTRPLPTASQESSPQPPNSNLLLSVRAPSVDLYDCPQAGCSVIGRLQQAMSLRAVSRAGSQTNPWIEVESQGRVLGWLKLDPQQLDYKHGLWDSLSLNQFIVATATPQ